ncbi:MAG: hypothetical protein ABII22_06530 [Candidatus Micrarchaeota archaeon]
MIRILGGLEGQIQLSVRQTVFQLSDAKARLLSLPEAENAMMSDSKLTSPVLTGTIIVCSGNEVFGREVVSGDMAIAVPHQFSWATGTLVLHPEVAMVREDDSKLLVQIPPYAIHVKGRVQFLGSANFSPESIGQYAGFCVLNGGEVHAFNKLSDTFAGIPTIPVLR